MQQLAPRSQNNSRAQLAENLFRLIMTVATAFLVALIVLPIAALLIHSSPGDLISVLRDPVVLQALRITALSSAASTLLIFMIGLPVAYAFSRRLKRLRPFLDCLLELPMVMPPIVAGLALLLAFGRRGLIGDVLQPLGIQFPFTLLAVILAQVFILTPYFVRRAAILLDGIDQELEAAASLLGAGPFYTLWHVTLPLCRRGLLAEAVMALAQGIGMFGAIILFAGNLPGRTQTLALAIYSSFQVDPEKAFALSALLLLISGALLIVFRILSHPRRERSHG